MNPGHPQGVMLTENDQLLEVQQYKQMYSCWFTNNRLVAGAQGAMQGL